MPDPSGAARAPQTLLERVKTETLPANASGATGRR